MLAGESQMGEGLESGLDIGMTLHVAGTGERSWTSLHQRGVIRLDSRAREQVFRPAGSRSSSHVVSHSPPSVLRPHFPWKFIPWEGQGSLKGSRLSSPTPTPGTRVPRGRRTPSCAYHTAIPQLNRDCQRAFPVLLLGLVPAPGPVRLGGGRVTSCPSLDPGDWVSPTWTTQSGATAPKASSVGQAEPVDLPGYRREAGLDQGSVSRCWGPGARRPRGSFSWALPLPSSQDPFCEWHQSTSRKGDAACSRRGRGRGALKSPEECPPLCSQ